MMNRYEKFRYSIKVYFKRKQSWLYYNIIVIYKNFLFIMLRYFYTYHA